MDDNYYQEMEKVWEEKYPSTNKIEEVEKFYKEMGYPKSPQLIIDELVSHISIKKINKILEFGCDNGIMLNYFKKYTSDLYGIDINSKSISNGKKLFPEFKLSKNDGIVIPFDDKYFDIIFSSAVLKHIRYADRPLMYDEFKRIGKYFIIIEENSNHKKKVKKYGFTFYMADFEKELSKHFKLLYMKKIKKDFIAVYET